VLKNGSQNTLKFLSLGEPPVYERKGYNNQTMSLTAGQRQDPTVTGIVICQPVFYYYISSNENKQEEILQIGGYILCSVNNYFIVDCI